MQLPADLFDQSTILTLTGASGAVYVVTSAIQHATNYNPRWLALLLSIALGIAGALTLQSPTLVDYLVGLINGCLIYCTTVGVNSVTAKPERVIVAKGKAKKSFDQQPRNFRSRWF